MTRWLAISVLTASLASAQTGPSTRPSDEGASAEQLLERMLRPGSAAPRALAPVAPAPAVDRASVQSVAPGAQPRRVIREGSYIVDRVGRLTRLSDGGHEFTFESDGSSLSDPPMLLLPNLQLMRIEQQVAGANRDLRFRVTGMVTEYQQRNYLLLEKAVLLSEPVAQF